MTGFIFRPRWALGDTICLSALVRDIQLAYPGKYRVSLIGHYANVYWRNNPHVYPVNLNENAQVVVLEYIPGIAKAKAGVKKHFLTYFHQEFEKHTGIHVPVFHPKGDIHLSTQEKAKKIIPGRYWIVMAGGKTDMTAKIWSRNKWQKTVDILQGKGIRCIQVGSTFSNATNPVLKNCESLVGKTNNERDFFSLIYNCEGVICGVTAAMHAAAVFDKPCVVVAGGREEPWWEEYSNNWGNFEPETGQVKVPHKFLHTIGLLDCGCRNANRGCWKSRTVPLEKLDLKQQDRKDKLCKLPVVDGAQYTPKCMDMITEDHVVDAVMSYYREGILPDVREKVCMAVSGDGGSSRECANRYTADCSSADV